MRAPRLLAGLLLVTMLTGCGKEETPPPSGPAFVDDEVLAQFVEAEQRLDGEQLTWVLGAGADLSGAATAIHGEWDAARKRLLGSLGPNGVVHPGDPATRLRLASSARDGGFDFASMAWSTWSLGLLYLGNDASGMVEHGPSVAGDVTTTESTTVTAAKRGPVASVRLSTTRAQSSRLGWSVSQTGTVELELPLCPDRGGVIAFDMQLKLTTTASAGTGATATVTDVLSGHTAATVNDDAELASIAITGGYDHTTGAPAGRTGIHVNVADNGISSSTTGSVTDAQATEAQAYGATLLRLAGSLAAARAGDYYEHGYCTDVVVSPDDDPTEVQPGATQPFDVRVKHTWDGGELTDRITARLDGGESVSPTERTATPTTLRYKAPDQKNRRATIHVESRSRRGVASADVAVKAPGGYAIHDVWILGNGGRQHLDAVNCDSPFGPWHVVISGDLAALGWRSLNAYYDITGDPATGTGKLTGEEHSVTLTNETYDGPSTGTAQFSEMRTEAGDGYLIKLEIDYDLLWHTPSGMEVLLHQEHIRGHSSRELHVVSATDRECP